MIFFFWIFQIWNRIAKTFWILSASVGLKKLCNVVSWRQQSVRVLLVETILNLSVCICLKWLGCPMKRKTLTGLQMIQQVVMFSIEQETEHKSKNVKNLTS